MVAVALMIPGITPRNESGARTENVCFPSLHRAAGLTPHAQAAPTNKQHCPHLLGDSFLCQISQQLFLLSYLSKQWKNNSSGATLQQHDCYWFIQICSPTS